jgi:hypothetical protein
MQLVLTTLTNRPIVYKMIRFDSADPATRQIVETIYINALEDAEAAAGADWVVGKAVGIGVREFQAGDVLELPNGKISIITGQGSRVNFDANEYTGTLPTITVDHTILAAIQYKPNQPKIQSIVDGEMTWQ